jgi:8-oxo-dGTP pyrophosphatase MutT (NUDIX family)
MTDVIRADRIGKQARIRLGCSAVLFKSHRTRLLLTRRSDNGQWCLPGGMVEPGESVAEACEREFFEETGLRVRTVKLTGVYSDPDLVTVYPDGNIFQVVVLNFEVELLDGKLGISNETTEARFFPCAEAVEMDLFHGHAGHVQDALSGQEGAFIR